VNEEFDYAEFMYEPLKVKKTMVAIKGFEMPDNCDTCRCFVNLDSFGAKDAGYMCGINADDLDEINILEERHPDCPLVEVEVSE